MSKRPIKLMVVDTVGGEIPASYASYFPGVRLYGHQQGDYGPCGPHGYQVGYWAGILLTQREDQPEVHFVRNFDGGGRAIPGSPRFILDKIAEIRPTHINHSWGQWDGDDRLGEYYADIAWRDFAREYRELQQEIRFVTTSAAGNNDDNDADVDTCQPWQHLRDCITIIGAAKRNGVPARWSADGFVDAIVWGQDMPLLSANRRWGTGSGTSFAAPAAMSLCMAEEIFDLEDWRAYIIGNATTPRGWGGDIPHPKWGYGNLTHRLMEHRAELPDHLLPPLYMQAVTHGLPHYEDFKEIHA